MIGRATIAFLGGMERFRERVIYGPNSTGRLRQSALRKVRDRVRICAKTPKAQLYDVRHTVGTYAAQIGINAFHIRALLDPQSIVMIARYIERVANSVRPARRPLLQLSFPLQWTTRFSISRANRSRL